jgi:hypothetical protein
LRVAFAWSAARSLCSGVVLLGSSPILGCRPPAYALPGTEAGVPALTRVPPPALPGFHAPTSLSVTGITLLGPSRAGGAVPNRRPRRLLVLLAWSFAACRSLYPGGSAGCCCRLLHPHRSASPLVRRVACRLDIFEASSGFHLRYGLLLRGITYVILSSEGFGKFVSSLVASMATGGHHAQRGRRLFPGGTRTR